MSLCQCLLVLLCLTTLVPAEPQVQHFSACNEAVCASLVSKCMLLKSCECDLSDKKNCTCCKDCHRCLSKLYMECCSCVGLCPPPDNVNTDQMSSTVGELPEPIPDLFDVLTVEEDPEQRWGVFSYPAHLDLLYFKPRGHQEDGEVEIEGGSEQGHRVRHGNHHAFIQPDTEYHNCTVAYMSQCMPLSKCSEACRSMGAARYRWFHMDGCCECIGDTCLSYGMGEPKCLKCPLTEEEEELENLYSSEQQHADDDDEEEEEEEEELEEIDDDDDEDIGEEQNRYVDVGSEFDLL